MAKKVRRKAEDEAFTFEFPEFDEAGFVWKEGELTSATILAGFFTIVLGLVGWVMSFAGLPWFAPLAVGFVLLIASVFVIRAVRPGSKLYTTGDWAGLLALEFFGWFSLWFLLLDLLPGVSH